MGARSSLSYRRRWIRFGFDDKISGRPPTSAIEPRQRCGDRPGLGARPTTTVSSSPTGSTRRGKTVAERRADMADKTADHSEALDVQKIHYLVRLMKRYDLTDLNLSDGKVQIRLKRRGPEPASPSVHHSPLIHP